MVTMYSTGCPQCEALEQMLNSQNIPHTICSDTDKMMSLGLTHVPALEADGKVMNFREAIAWIGEQS